VSKSLTANVSLQLAAERTYRRVALRAGGTGTDADNYIWDMYLVTVQARF
jgi:hypothetical protein